MALEMSLGRRAKPIGLLLHTDQGVQYRTARYQALLAQNNIQPSMSRKGNCHDNAAMESFFHTLKTEHVRHHKYRTFDEARQSLFDYIEVFYNRQRRHSYLVYMTPFEYERYTLSLRPVSVKPGLVQSVPFSFPGDWPFGAISLSKTH